jgi:hypothetical protein
MTFYRRFLILLIKLGQGESANKNYLVQSEEGNQDSRVTVETILIYYFEINNELQASRECYGHMV